MRTFQRLGLLLVLIVTNSFICEMAFAGRRNARRTHRPIADAAPVEPTATSGSPASDVIPPPVPLKIDPRQAMADIMSLRQAQGLADPDSSAAFASALQKLIIENHGQPALPPAEEIAPVAEILPDPSRAGNNAVATLRGAARHFDDRANDLEAANDYAAADAARETAGELRREARRLAQ